MSKLITSAEAAKKLGFTPDWIRRLISQGKIKAIKQGHIYFMKESALKNISRQRFPRNEE